MIPEATRMSDFITLPNAEEGCVKAVTASADASGIDLRTIGSTPGSAPSNLVQGQDGQGLLNHYITVQADGADVWIVAGAAQASVTGANAPSASAVGTGIIGTPATGISFKVPKETERSFIPKSDRDRKSTR